MKELTALRVGHRYTLVKLSDFGFPYSACLELVESKTEPYAQHRETMLLTFKLKGKRNLRQLRIFERDNYLIYEGWIAVNTEMFVEELPGVAGLVVQKSLRCFSTEYFDRAKRSIAQKPLIEKLQNDNDQ
jgi:hypothetical protein